VLTQYEATPNSLITFAELANGALVSGAKTRAHEFACIAQKLADELISVPNYQVAGILLKLIV
jgi:hypothetical protein